jgi:hypothetical protein
MNKGQLYQIIYILRHDAFLLSETSPAPFLSDFVIVSQSNLANTKKSLDLTTTYKISIWICSLGRNSPNS